jgi:hypothetical protein
LSEVLTKAAFARRQHVSASDVSVWIRNAKLTAPALTPDGRVDVALALAQIAVTLRPKRTRGTVTSAVSSDLIRAAALSIVFNTFEEQFFPSAVRALGLTDSQGADLERCWHRFRARQSIGPGEPGGGG